MTFLRRAVCPTHSWAAQQLSISHIGNITTTMSRIVVVITLVVLGSGGGAEAARILGIFPTPSISHQLPYQAVMKALVARGHEITVISTDPLKEPLANYTDINLSFSYKTFRERFVFAEQVDMTAMGLMSTMTTGMPYLLDEQLGSSTLQEFLRTNPKFDLVFVEWFWFQAYFGVVHHVGSPPMIGIISLGGLTNSYKAISNPVNPAYNPDIFLGYSDHMSFFERVYNTYVNIWISFHWYWHVFPSQEALMRKHFGEAPPPVAETEKNMSLLVLHNHWSTDYARAMLPNIVQITGNHVKDNPGPLPKDLQEWLDGADHGVVYMSLGSNVMSKDLPLPTREAILRAFARLPQRVLWKWEEDELPGRPANVRVSKWLPQQAVLKHPRLRLFVTQGGLQSFQEAVFHTVPLLGIPFFGDQQYNMAKIDSSGVGKRLQLRDLTEETFFEAATTIINDNGYKERIKQMSAVFREHRATSLDTALWWIEYVLRHNGAPHLRSAAQDLTWYQYLLLDVLAALLAGVAVLFYTVMLIFRTVWRMFRRSDQDHRYRKLKRKKE